MKKLQKLRNYVLANFTEEFSDLVEEFAITNDSWALIRFVKKNFIGYERESIIVNIRAIREEEAAYKTMEFAVLANY